MPTFTTQDGAIYFEQFGARANPSVVLIHGLGCQIVHWPQSFINGLVDAGFRVVVMDNRGVGFSMDLETEAPSIDELVAIHIDPKKASPLFTLNDMANDVAALLDHIGQSGAHIIGTSLGGMVAQHVAFSHSHRVHSLTCMMSSTGNPDLPGPSEEAMAAMVASQSATGKKNVIAAAHHVGKVNGGSFFDSTEVGIARFTEAAFDRSHRPEATAHQFVAMTADGDRRPLLKSIAVPTLIIHGTEDPLIPHAAGEDLAENIPDSALVSIEKMGHDIPEPLIGEIVASISKHLNHTVIAR